MDEEGDKRVLAKTKTTIFSSEKPRSSLKGGVLSKMIVNKISEINSNYMRTHHPSHSRRVTRQSGQVKTEPRLKRQKITPPQETSENDRSLNNIRE